MTRARPYLLPRCHIRALTLSKRLKSQWRFILTVQIPNIWGFQNECHVRAYTLSNFFQKSAPWYAYPAHAYPTY